MGSSNEPRNDRILVVEDHLESAELLRMILENEGYEARCVETGRDALRVLMPASGDDPPDWRPDLILLDLRLPDMNGVDVVSELRKSLPSVPPVVLISADSQQILNGAASRVNAAAVRKPFDFDDLFRIIERELDKWRDPTCAISKCQSAK